MARGARRGRERRGRGPAGARAVARTGAPLIAVTIKRVTGPLHVRAEQALAQVDPLASEGAYVAYLERLRSFYAALEPELAGRLEGIVPDVDRRRKLAHIDADLAAFDATAAHVPVTLPPIRDEATALGVAYVLEGKTLGARFLLAEAVRRLGLDAERGAAFFAGYGTETGAMWRSFRAALEEWSARHGRRAAIVHGAEATFEAFISTVTA